jgi:hypothetical protein
MATDDRPKYAGKVPRPGEIQQRSAAERVAAGSAAVSAATQLWQTHKSQRRPQDAAPPPPPPKDE